MPWLHWLPWLQALYGGTVQTAATLVSSRKSGFVALKRFNILLAAVLGCIFLKSNYIIDSCKSYIILYIIWLFKLYFISNDFYIFLFFVFTKSIMVVLVIFLLAMIYIFISNDFIQVSYAIYYKNFPALRAMNIVFSFILFVFLFFLFLFIVQYQ